MPLNYLQLTPQDEEYSFMYSELDRIVRSELDGSPTKILSTAHYLGTMKHSNADGPIHKFKVDTGRTTKPFQYFDIPASRQYAKYYNGRD